MANISISRIEATHGRISVQIGETHIATVACDGLLAQFQAIDAEIRRNGGLEDPSAMGKRTFHAVQTTEPSSPERMQVALRLLHAMFQGAVIGQKVRAEVLDDLKKTGHAIVDGKAEPGRSKTGPITRNFWPTGPAPRQMPHAIQPGAGYVIDQLLRLRLAVVNEHEQRGEPEILTKTSFALLSHFLAKNPLVSPYSTLLPEIDHAFDLADFYAVHDNEGFPDNSLELLRTLPERRIHNYTPINPWHYAEFAADPAPNIVGGISLVRIGDEIAWILTGGPVLDLKAQQDWLVDLLARAPIGITRKQAATMPPSAMPGTTNVWDVQIWGSLDIAARERHPFGISIKAGQTMDVYYDLAEGTDRLVGIDETGQILLDRLPLQDLYSYVRELLHLPIYFRARVEYVKDVPVTPRTPRPASQTGRGPTAPLLEYRHRTVATLHALPRVPATAAQPEAGQTGRTRREPDFNVVMSGTWRTLRPTQIGRGPDGKPEVGRTWVQDHRRYKDKPDRPNLIRVKQPVSASLDLARSESSDGSAAIRY